MPNFINCSQYCIAFLNASLSNAMYMSSTPETIILFSNALEIDFPSTGTAFLLIAIASNTPSHIIIGWFQLIRFSKKTMSFDVSGFLYLK